jgi:predicted nucleic acid-binding protein
LTRLVVDASVAIKWFVPERHSSDAHRLLSENYELLAPDLIWPELANALWKKHQRGELIEAAAKGILRDFARFSLVVQPSAPFVDAALDIAVRRGHTVYDSLYLAVAVARQCALVTADNKLYQAVKRGPLSAHLLWVAHVE